MDADWIHFVHVGHFDHVILWDTFVFKSGLWDTFSGLRDRKYEQIVNKLAKNTFMGQKKWAMGHI